MSAAHQAAERWGWHPVMSDWGVALEALAPEAVAACCCLCGREYDDLNDQEVALMAQGEGCPSDDCPGKWELKGRVHPDA